MSIHSIRDVAAASGITTRTLRHYDAVGLLPAGRGTTGSRVYTDADLVRLQRILLLRDLGMGLRQIGDVFAGGTDDLAALRGHAERLRRDRDTLDRRLCSVERTITALQRQEVPPMDDMFDGFDNEHHRDEVVDRWGEQAWAEGDSWWRRLGDDGRLAFQQESRELAAAWRDAREAGLAPDDGDVQEIAARHVDWITVGWQGRRPEPQALIGLAEMYVADPRFAANYADPQDDDAFTGARFVRDALVVFAGTG